jgi:glyoxylase-like metal-dependent hydrolase (beta-lactamase superfamily II)
MWHIHLFTFSPIQENTYLLYNDAREAVIIDPGCYHSYEEDELKDFVQAKQLKPVLLLNTHCHLDHVFGLRWVAAQYRLTPHIHANEEQVLKLAPVAGDMWNMPFVNYNGPLNYLKEGDIVTVGDSTIHVLFTPGHAPGHVCFYCPQQHFVIGGDVLFQRSIGRTDLPGANHRVLIESIRQQLFTLPDNTVVFPGHGPKTTIGEEKKHNPFLQQAY